MLRNKGSVALWVAGGLAAVGSLIGIGAFFMPPDCKSGEYVILPAHQEPNLIPNGTPSVIYVPEQRVFVCRQRKAS